MPFRGAPERYREMYCGRELHLRRNVPADMRAEDCATVALIYTREGAIRAQRGMRSRILHVSCYSGFGNSRRGNISLRVAV